ncbi:MAG: ComF family protein, partial [Pseudohongiellaceae bacterium]
PPAFDSTQALFHYAKPVRQLISLFKFHGRLEIGASFAYLLAQRFQHTVRRLPTSARPQLLLPVPLHPRRMNMRGFNQSEELVRGLSSLAGIPSCRSLVRRVRHTPSQTEMTDAASRRRNLRSAFTVQACAKLGTIRRVAVVDDVMTTGATVDALAQSLKAHGVAQVDVWCLARAGL